jgi:hypothetical protein
LTETRERWFCDVREGTGPQAERSTSTLGQKARRMAIGFPACAHGRRAINVWMAPAMKAIQPATPTKVRPFHWQTWCVNARFLIFLNDETGDESLDRFEPDASWRSNRTMRISPLCSVCGRCRSRASILPAEVTQMSARRWHSSRHNQCCSPPFPWCEPDRERRHVAGTQCQEGHKGRMNATARDARRPAGIGVFATISVSAREGVAGQQAEAAGRHIQNRN